MSLGDNFYVISGGPGSGKSSLLLLLRNRGFKIMPEAGRAIIKDQVEVGGSALPWANQQLFAELMLGWELRSYHEAGEVKGPVFFDRGLPDVAGYLRVCGLEAPRHISVAASKFRYHKRVFMAPPWRDIFRADEERKQSWSEAVATFDALSETYESLGYDIVPLPLTSVEKRADFICGHCDGF